MPMGYGYGGYPTAGGYYAPPMPDNLAQLRGAQYQQPMQGPMQPQQMQQPVQQQPMMQTPQQAQQPTMSGPVFVNGEAGAKGYLVAAGNTVMLIDADPDANTFWLKSADAAGMPSMRTFDYTERLSAPKVGTVSAQMQTVEYVTKEDFNALAARYDAIVAELEELKAKRQAPSKKAVKEETEDA